MPVGAPHKGYRSHVEVSPDGNHLGVSIQTTNDIRVFSYDLARGTLSRIGESVKGEVLMASWSRDDRIALQVIDGGKAPTTDSSGPTPPLPRCPSSVPPGFWVSSLSPQGRLAGVDEGDIVLYSPSSNAAGPSTFLKTTAGGNDSDVVAGRPMARLHLRHHRPATKSTCGRLKDRAPRPWSRRAGGSNAAWNPNGRELFYLEPGQCGRIDGGPDDVGPIPRLAAPAHQRRCFHTTAEICFSAPSCSRRMRSRPTASISTRCANFHARRRP